MSPFICSNCKKVVDLPTSRVKVSIDYMRADEGERIRRVHVKDLCRGCAVDEAARLRHQDIETIGIQEALL